MKLEINNAADKYAAYLKGFSLIDVGRRCNTARFDEQYGASNLPPQFFVYANTAADAAVFSGEKVYLSNGSWVYDDLVKWENGNTYKFAAYAVKDAEGLPAGEG